MRRVILTFLALVLLLTTSALIAQPAIAEQQLPDLIILNTWQSGSQICYTIKNIGQGSVGGGAAPVSFYNVLFIDGKQVAEDHITASLASGQQLDRCFSYQWQAEPGEHRVGVCADSRQDVAESNEANNCREQVWVVEEGALPDLIVEKIECSPDSKLSVTIKNIGSGTIPSGWKALADTYFDGVRKGAFDLTYPTSTLNGGIEKPGGSSVYLPGWDITGPVTVRVIVDITDEIKESNEQNNSREEKIEPLVVELPDLVIEQIKCDRESSRIGYVMKNIGQGVAKAGHTAALYIDGKEISHDLVGVDLKPGATYESWFKEYKWPECRTIKTRVCADNYDQVKESNEQNNCLEEVFECIADTIPPQIISGPTVSELTQTSAVICWQTDEASDSAVLYDNRAGKYGYVVEDPKLVTEHCLHLTNLEPGVTYHFVVESKDSSGNEVRSRDINFETLSPPDKESPSLSLLIPDTLSGQVTISAVAQDNIGVDRVIFFLDGVPAHTDYALPFEWQLNTGGLGEGSHNFGAQAYDVAGNSVVATLASIVRNIFPVDLSPVMVEIIVPESGAEVYGEVLVSVRVTHDLDSGIAYIEFRLDGETIWSKDYLAKFEHYVGTPLYEGASYDLSGLEPGSTHVIEVGAKDQHDNWGHAGIRVRISEPEISVRRLEPIRHGNYFEINLVIENNGVIDIDELTVRETNMCFQCLKSGSRKIRGPYGRFIVRPIEYEVTTSHSGHSSTISTGNLGTLRSGQSIELEYYAVPVLFWSEGNYSLGQPLELSYEAGGRGYVEYPPCTWIAPSEEIDRAFVHADYLIVTNPRKLFEYNAPNDADVNELFVTMAELAKEKNGVLGHTFAADPRSLKGRISEGGRWYEKLAPFDYLLLVGEAPGIVPAAYIRCHVHFNGDGTCPVCGAENVLAVTTIRLSDSYYADIYHDDEIPDIKVGRIIGKTAQELITPIRASIDVHRGEALYDASNAYLVSGPEGTWESFIDNLDRKTMPALLDEGVRPVYLMYNAEFYTTQRTLLREALQIRCKEPAEMKGEGATWDNYTVEELACWLLLCEDRDEIMRRIAYRPSWVNDAWIFDHAAALVSGEVLNHALEIAEAIQHNRRGFVFGEYTYDDWTSAECLSNIASSVKHGTPDKDIIIFSGHGGPGSWACVLDDWTTSPCPVEPISFGSHRPIVIAFSCLTGNYGGSESIARAFLRNNAAVYIGSTEVSPCDMNEYVETQKLWEYWSTTSRIGDAFLELERWMMMMTQDSTMWRFVAHEYNLYGDPKFGGR